MNSVSVVYLTPLGFPQPISTQTLILGKASSLYLYMK